MSDDSDDICGETFDHDLRLIDERDGDRSYECRVCGAEIYESDDQEDQT